MPLAGFFIGARMADNFDTSPPTAGGATFKSYQDSGDVHWPVGVCAYVSALGDPDTLQPVLTSAGLPVQQQSGHTFAVSLAATSNFNLASYGGSAVGAGNAVHIQPGTGAVFQVGDNGSSITVDNSGTFAVQAAQSGSWTVTANAGTNLNTSALALESGGNLAGAATSLAIIDDWDESDRAKANIIVGQAGVAAGAGAVGATTQRMTLASDDPAVTALQILDNAISGNEMQVDVVTFPTDSTASGAITAVDQTVAGPTVAGRSSVAIHILGTWVGTIVFEKTVEGVTWQPAAFYSQDINGGDAVTSTTTNGLFFAPVGSAQAFRVRSSVWGLGSGGIYWESSVGAGAVAIAGQLPSGTNAIGKLAANSGVDIGDVDVLSVPSDPFGANGDAASATGSISAKLRFIASTGIPITGTVTVGSHDVTNAGAFAVQSAQSGAWTVTANAGTGTFVVGDGGGSLTVDGTVAVSSVGGTVTVTGAGGTFPVTDSGGSLTVDGTVAATQSGTWNIGTVTTVSSVTAIANALPAGTNNIGDVDVLSLVPGTGATNLGKAEDAAHSSGDVGVMMLAVRQDSQTALAADGDYLPPTIDAAGGLRVSVVSGASGGTSSADDADFTAGSTSGTPAMGVYESAPSSVTDGDLGVVGITATRAMRVNVDNTVTVTGAGGTFPVTDSSGSLTVDAPVGTPVFVRLSDGSSAISTLPVSLASVPSHAVTNAGTFVVQENGAALTALQLIDDVVFTDDAAFTPASSKVIAVGFQADETATDSVNEGDIGCPRMTLDRKPIIADYADASAGADGFHLVGAGTTNATVVKASPGTVYSVVLTKDVSAVSTHYVKFVDKATAPTAGSETVLHVCALQQGDESYCFTFPKGLKFSSGISFFTVTGLVDSNSTAIPANILIIDITYK